MSYIICKKRSDGHSWNLVFHTSHTSLAAARKQLKRFKDASVTPNRFVIYKELKS